MITNINQLFPVMVQKLENSSFEFFPTGSRYFGGYRPDSDWDFIAETSSEIEQFLILNGFEAISDEEYNGDDLIDVVYRYGIVDVQLSRRLREKLHIQDILRKLYPHGLPSDKEAKKLLWSNTTALLKLLEK